MDINGYYGKAVLWALENGITNGTPGGMNFSPDMTVDRDQTVTFMYRMAGQPYVGVTDIFSDVGADSYYSNAVS